MESGRENLYVDIFFLLPTNFANITEDPKPAMTQWHVEEFCRIVAWK